MKIPVIVKRILIALFTTLALVFILHATLFDNAFTYHSLSNAFFIVGLFLFFVSLIVVTDAGRVFMIVTYSAKIIFKKNPEHKSYYDYMKSREREKMTPYAVEFLIISSIYIAIAFMLTAMFERL